MVIVGAAESLGTENSIRGNESDGAAGDALLIHDAGDVFAKVLDDAGVVLRGEGLGGSEKGIGTACGARLSRFRQRQFPLHHRGMPVRLQELQTRRGCRTPPAG